MKLGRNLCVKGDLGTSDFKGHPEVRRGGESKINLVSPLLQKCRLRRRFLVGAF